MMWLDEVLVYTTMQNDFCTYMLNEYQERETMGKQKKDLFPDPLKLLQRLVENYKAELCLSRQIIRRSFA